MSNNLEKRTLIRLVPDADSDPGDCADQMIELITSPLDPPAGLSKAAPALNALPARSSKLVRTFQNLKKAGLTGNPPILERLKDERLVLLAGGPDKFPGPAVGAVVIDEISGHLEILLMDGEVCLHVHETPDGLRAQYTTLDGELLPNVSYLLVKSDPC